MRDANIDFRKIHNIILSNKHTDHILGLFWIIRYSARFFSSDNYDGNLNIYVHKELESTLRKILDYNIKFLDVQAKKDRQFGFKTTLENGKKLYF